MIRRFLDDKQDKNKEGRLNKNKKNILNNNSQSHKKDKIEINKILKKNQVVILTIALMLMTAGYMNYTNNHENENMLLAELGDAKLVSANVQEIENTITNEMDNYIKQNETANEIINTVENSINNKITNQEDVTANVNSNALVNDVSAKSGNNNILENVSEQNISQNTVETASSVANPKEESDYFTKSKLEREIMYSQMLETYQDILEDEKIPSDQKGIAQNEIKNINDTKNALMIVENLLKTKGFKNVIVFINGQSINVVTEQENLTTEQVAQIQNIVQRELNADIQNIHITSNKNEKT